MEDDDYIEPDVDYLLEQEMQEQQENDNYFFDQNTYEVDTVSRVQGQPLPFEDDDVTMNGGSSSTSTNHNNHDNGAVINDSSTAENNGQVESSAEVYPELDTRDAAYDTIFAAPAVAASASLLTNRSTSTTFLSSVPILPPTLSIDAQTNRMAMNLSASYSAYLKGNGQIYRSNSTRTNSSSGGSNNNNSFFGWGRKNRMLSLTNETTPQYLQNRPGASNYGDLPITIDGNMYFLPYTLSPIHSATFVSSKSTNNDSTATVTVSSHSSKPTNLSNETSNEFRNLLETVHMNIASKRIDAVARARAILQDDSLTLPLPISSIGKNNDDSTSKPPTMDTTTDQQDNEQIDDVSPDPQTRQQIQDNANLWVSKYAPRLFVDLLSPDAINREVLKWIKQWDSIVFGNKNSSTNGENENDSSSVTMVPFKGSKGTRPSPGAKGGPVKSGGGPRTTYNYPSSTNKFYLKSKVLLICGPPGTGKTTLAHIAAHQAGYRTAEVNASDDRTGKSIRDLINSAQTMRSVFGDKRPVCVVLDEIDGMEGGPTGGVAELVKMIKATNKAAAMAARAKYNNNSTGDDVANESSMKGNDDDDNDDFGENSTNAVNTADNGKENSNTKRLSGKKRNRNTGNTDNDNDDNNEGSSNKSDTALVLTRPLICICNDVYASVLRELRPLVQIVELGPPSPDRLRERIQLICRNEGLSITPDAASTLVRLTDADIRSCLNTLQFIKAQQSLHHTNKDKNTNEIVSTVTRIRITSETIERAAVSSKDETKALLDVWSSVYSAQLARSGASSPSLRYLDLGNTPQSPMNIIWQQTTAYASDSRLLLSGLEENLLRVNTSDPTLSHTVQALDWLCFGEEIGHKVASTQMYTLSKYLPAATAGIHLHRASDIRVRMQWPRTDALMRSKHEHHRNIVEAFMHGRATAPGNILGAGSLDHRSTILDLLSPLLTITNPPLRAIGNLSLMNAVEQKDVANLVHILCTNGIDYTPPSAQNRFGGINMDIGRSILQPAIDQVLTFDHSLPFDGQLRTIPLPEVLRELITHQLRFARVRYSRSSRDNDSPSSGTVPSINGSSSSSGSTVTGGPSLPPVELPEHVKKQLMATGTSAASHTASTSALAATDIMMNDSKPNDIPQTRNFLAEAASKSRGAELARKRIQVLDQQQQTNDNNNNNTGSNSSNSNTVASTGRTVGNGTTTTPSNTGTTGTTIYPVVYKYQEGFTNAVKRSLKLQDFL